MINPYEVLGVHRKSSDREIRQEYLRLAQKYHPDKNRKVDNTSKFVDVNTAYKNIKDKEARIKFAETYSARKPTCLKCKGAGCTSKAKGLTAKEYTACTTCNGAGVMFNKKEETNDVTIELRGTAGTIRKGRNNKR